MAFETLQVDTADRIATVTINRPDKLNALNAQVKRELGEAFAALAADTAADVIILTGAGPKAFVAGTDIGELAELDRPGGEAFSAGGQRIFDAVEACPKPVIAAVNGFALGGGCELAMACHIRIAADTARFGQPEVNLGIIPGYGGTQRLARLVGAGKAFELILTGAPVDAAEALRIGLVNAVVPAAELMTAARAMAAAIASRGQVAVRFALDAVRRGMDLPLAEGQRLEARLFGDCCASEDFREGTRAFLEKRKPAFVNR